MECGNITFEKLPEAVGFLIREVQRLNESISSLTEKQRPQKKTPLSVEQACEIIGKAKVTVYAMARKGLIPHYKSGRKLYFFEEELLEWIVSGKIKISEETREEVEAFLNSGIKRKPKCQF